MQYFAYDQKVLLNPCLPSVQVALQFEELCLRVVKTASNVGDLKHFLSNIYDLRDVCTYYGVDKKRDTETLSRMAAEIKQKCSADAAFLNEVIKEQEQMGSKKVITLIRAKAFNTTMIKDAEDAREITELEFKYKKYLQAVANHKVEILE